MGPTGSRVQDVLVIPVAHLQRVHLIQVRKERPPFLGAGAKRMNLRGAEKVELALPQNRGAWVRSTKLELGGVRGGQFRAKSL